MNHLNFVIPTVLAALALSGCRKETSVAAANQTPVPVKLARVAVFTRPQAIEASGNVLAGEQAAVSFEIPGRVLRVHAMLGDRVRRGQVLAELDTRELSYHESMAAAQASAAGAVASKARNGSRVEEIDAERAAVRQAEAAARMVEAEHKRAEFLFSRRSLTASDMDRARTERDVAANRLAEARAKLQAYETGARAEEKQQADAMASAASSQRDIAKKKLSDARLLSPIDGYVALRNIDAGQNVGAGMPAYVIVSIQPVKVSVGVTENEISLLKPGQKAEVNLPALDGAKFKGTVARIGVAADPATRLFTVELTVPNRDAVLKPGMIAKASVFTGRTVQALGAPLEAVVRSPEGVTSVYAYDRASCRVFLRRADFGALRNGIIEVRGGLKEGEPIVTEGRQHVADGALVKAIERQ